MTLIEKIKEDQIAARKAKESIVATLLTTVIGDATTVAKNAKRADPTDEEVLAVVRKFLKGNTDTQEALQKMTDEEERKARFLVAGRERAILNSYLPKQLSEFELKAIIEGAVAAGAPKDIGALMGFLKKNHAGLYDGKAARGIIESVIA